MFEMPGDVAIGRFCEILGDFADNLGADTLRYRASEIAECHGRRDDDELIICLLVEPGGQRVGELMREPGFEISVGIGVRLDRRASLPARAETSAFTVGNEIVSCGVIAAEDQLIVADQSTSWSIICQNPRPRAVGDQYPRSRRLHD